jgi:hypothetical protein
VQGGPHCARRTGDHKTAPRSCQCGSFGPAASLT